MHELVHLRSGEGIATITLDSPDTRNALSTQVMLELQAHLESAIADPTVRAIVLTHTGPVFCAGMDLKESRGAAADAQPVNEFPRILQTIWTSPTPVLARLSGAARAGGVGLVAACDLAVVSDQVSFAFTEVRIGVVPATISVTVLPRLLPRAAAELFMTGETFTAARAVAIGLVNSAVPTEALDAEVDRYLEMLRLGAPEALAATKELLHRPAEADLGAAFAAMQALSARHFASAEAQEGMAAFAAKRRPAWAPDRLSIPRPPAS